MNNLETEETSNEDATIISELLSSAETMLTSTVPTTNASAMKNPLQQKDESQVHPNISGISSTFCDITKNIMVSLQQDHSLVGRGLLNSTRHSDMEDLNKMHIRHVHIPYILNGELYQIQTQDGENVTVKCCHCPPDRVYRGSVRSTGNFHMHIKRRHPDLLEKLHNMKINALLERRDRLMRNRKITHRNNRNRSTNSIASSTDMCSFNNEEKPQLTSPTPNSQTMLDSTPDSSLMHTHKLKIKTVFQRHQMQQKEAEKMRNWSSTEYVVMPIDNSSTNEECEQPLNYSLKFRDNQDTTSVLSTSSININQQSQEHQEKSKPNEITAHISIDESFQNLSNQPSNLSPSNAPEQNIILACENRRNNDINLTSSASISCPSAISSYTSSHQYEIEINRPYSSFTFEHQNLSIVKPEHLLLGAETEAIDLTMHTDSGIFSNSEDDSENNNDCRINNVKAGLQKSNTNNVTIIDAEYNVDSDNNKSTNTAKWQELFMQVENSLRDIQREMNVRNQIESNRMFLDIAKFKFLNPGFQYNW